MRRGQLCRLGNRRDDHRAELIGSVTPRNQEQSGHLKTLTWDTQNLDSFLLGLRAGCWCHFTTDIHSCSALNAPGFMRAPSSTRFWSPRTSHSKPPGPANLKHSDEFSCHYCLCCSACPCLGLTQKFSLYSLRVYKNQSVLCIMLCSCDVTSQCR